MKMRFYYLMLLLTELSNFAFYIPYYFVKYAREGLPIAIIIGFIAISITEYFQISCYNKYKDMTLVQIYRKLFGRVIGTTGIIILAVMRLAAASFFFAAGIRIINQYLLFQSPRWHIILPLVILLFFVLKFKPRNYIYCKAFFTVLAIIWIAILFAIGTRDMNFAYIQGTIVHSINPPRFVLIASTAFFFGGVHYLAIYNPDFKKINLKGTMIANLCGGLPILLLAIFLPLAIWGPETVKILSFIQAGTLDTLTVDMFVIERVLYIGIPLLFSLLLFNIEGFSYVAYHMIIGLSPSSKLFAKGAPFVILLVFVLITVYIEIQKLVEAFEVFLILWVLLYTLINLSAYLLMKIEGRHSV